MQRPILRLLVCTGLYKWTVACALCYDRATSAEHRLDIFNAYSMPTVSLAAADLDDDFGQKMLESLQALIGMDSKAFEVVYGFVRDDVAQSLSMIDWAGEFERLQN
jgi:hypothetical protein